MPPRPVGHRIRQMSLGYVSLVRLLQQPGLARLRRVVNDRAIAPGLLPFLRLRGQSEWTEPGQV